MTNANEMVAVGALKMNGGVTKFHAVPVNGSPVCGGYVGGDLRITESLAHVNCARCLAKLEKFQ